MSQFNYYDNIAHLYDRTRWMTESVAEEIAEFILELVKATPTTSFLEPGVGTGLNVLPLVKRGYSVTGIDISQEMIDRFRQKLHEIPLNLKLIHADASQLPFTDCSFDVVLTVNMIHTVANWQQFLREIDRVLKPQGFYLNARWITPPARLEFENYLRAILAEYRVEPRSKVVEIDIESYFQSQGYQSNYAIASEWTVSNSVEELLSFYKLKAYGLCWSVSDKIFKRIIKKFEEFCVKKYGSLTRQLSSQAKYEVWIYAAC
ncbi:class I SAM-dependent methyltransferase [Myxosarcina sp. GI1]|uniref:class I SAM-dependent methyltransferase n=1 Tax=Myxosarcina sp. GI1 TaxID=1541065 RepID=UPI0005609A47|nr:class I SAM-dependent methyltransferase [Myxosarcina sp. GI1]